MSGPFPPSGDARSSGTGGWPGPAFPAPGSTGERPPGTSGRPPSPGGRRRTGLIVVAVLCPLVVVGVLTAVLVLEPGPQRQVSPAIGAASADAPVMTTPVMTTPVMITPGPTTSLATTSDAASGMTPLVLAVGDCVTAVAVPTEAGASQTEYVASQKVPCGAANSDFMVAKLAARLDDCAASNYLRLRRGTGFYCFTLDLKQGDCVTAAYLKTACRPGVYTLIRVESGPVRPTSCADTVGATRWVPVSRAPELVGCIGLEPSGAPTLTTRWG